MPNNFRIWLAITGASTLVIGAAYVMVQQSTRLAADDLPLATAQTVKAELESGSAPSDVVPSRTTDLKTNDNVFVIVTDNSRHVLASSASLDGQTPLPPSGVFDYTAASGTDHFTWQPETGVREATRVMTYSKDASSGFIITGQSLRQVENREDIYTEMAVAAWFAVLVWTYLTLLLPKAASPAPAPKNQKKKK